MSDARTAVLHGIRQALGRGELSGAPLEAARRRLAQPQPNLVPALAGETVDVFVARAQALSMTLERVADLAAVPAAVARYAEAHGLPPRAVLAAPLAPLAWPSTLEVRTGPARRDDTLGVTPCVAAIAETGSLVLASSPDTPTTLAFVPDNHVAVLHRRQIVRTQEEAWARLRTAPWPRAVNTISGPSRTADVEQVLQLGVHGPRRVHVVLVED